MIASLYDQYAPRTREMRAFTQQEHYRYQRRPAVHTVADEVILGDDWDLAVVGPDTPLLDRAVNDFRAWLMTCMDVRPVGGDGGKLRLEVTGKAGAVGDRLDPASEAFTLRVAPGEIVISAVYERGLLHGTHYLERLLADRGGPFLPVGESTHQPAYMPRIGNSAFIGCHQDCGDLEQFDHEYLSLLSHFGINGVHLHLDLWDYCKNTVVPEVNCPDFDAQMARVNRVVERLAEHGIDTYFYLVAAQLPADHLLWQVRPDMRGSATQCLAGMPKRYVACTANPDVQRLQQQMIGNLLQAVPGAAGAIMIVGGEGFMHCYSRPLSPYDGYTDCPNCTHLAPARPLAAMVNRIAAVVRAAGSGKLLFAWPYSAFTWSGEDKAQREWIEALDPDVQILANYDCNSADPTNDANVVLYDYNIKSIGPSTVFQAQADKAHELGRRIHTKTETNTTPSVFFVPYLPVHCRWHARFRSFATTGVSGFMCQWRFYGPNGSPPEEMLYHAIWNPERDTADLLATVARRDFGLDDAAAAAAVAAWEAMSAAWDDFPYSALTAGERSFYMAGPLWYGPAHPLIWDPRRSYGLGPEWRALCGTLGEGNMTAEETAELLARNPPRYVTDLMITVPYGVDYYLELLDRCIAGWDKALAALTAAIGPDPAERAAMELDVAGIMLVHLRSLANTVRFFQIRDSLWQGRLDNDGFRERVSAARRLVRDEIANAEAALPILARDNRIGYIHCYGIAYTDVMVRDKIRQCHNLLDEELNLFDSTMRFHLWNDYTVNRA